MKLEISVVL